jgi:hypothetical protein
MLAITQPQLQFKSKSTQQLLTPPDWQRVGLAAKFMPIQTLPGQCHQHYDRLTQERSHSFAFKLDQMRKVSIDVANQRHPGLFGDLIYSRNIEVMLRSESGDQRRLFSVAPGDRDREVITLQSGRYLLELKTKTSKTVSYALKLTAMKWLLLEFA